MTLFETFWDHFRREPSGCLVWTRARLSNGYGVVYDPTAGRSRSAHIVAYEKHHGVKVRDAMVLHKCDNRACGEPAHLFLGDAKTNYDDSRVKGRNVCGERSHLARLRTGDVVAIKQGLATGERICALARRYRVSASAIGDIKAGRTWRHLQ